MNLNSVATEITKSEGKKVEVNIAQTKEILRVLIDLMACNTEIQDVVYEAVHKKMVKNKVRTKKKSTDTIGLYMVERMDLQTIKKKRK